MACRICRRSSCTESFHSLEQQELFDAYEASESELTFNEWQYKQEDS